MAAWQRTTFWRRAWLARRRYVGGSSVPCNDLLYVARLPVAAARVAAGGGRGVLFWRGQKAWGKCLKMAQWLFP